MIDLALGFANATRAFPSVALDTLGLDLWP